MVKRREFIKNVAAGTALSLAGPRLWGAPLKIGDSDKFGDILPKRRLGKTGEDVTIYCIGGAHVSYAESEKESQAIIEKGMELGVRYFENAWTYSKGKAEELFGKYLVPKYRDQIFLATKNKGRTREEIVKQLEDSFRRMKCDVIDLYYIHEIRSVQDVDDRLAAGALEVILEAQQKGRIRHIGFTGHYNPDSHKHIVELVAGEDPFAAVQVPVSPIDAAKPNSWIHEFLPIAVKKGYGISGMKGFAHGRFFPNNQDKYEARDYIVPNHLSLEEVLWYNLSQAVASIVVGTDAAWQLDQNIAAVRKFEKLSRKDQEAIVAKLEGFRMVEGLEGYRPKPGTQAG